MTNIEKDATDDVTDDVADDVTYVPDDDTFNYKGIERMRSDEFDDLYRTYPLTDETTCGLWICRGNFLQK